MSTSLNQINRARVVQLYCPEHEATVNNFIITPSMEYDDVLAHVKAAFRRFDLDDIRLCDINGGPLYDNDDCPSCFSDIAHGERLLVAVGDERIRPEPELKVVLFQEDDSLPKTLRKLAREDRRNHIRTLRRADAVSRLNILRLTLPYSDVLAALSDLDNATAHQMKSKYSLRSSQRIIAGHWFVEKLFKSEPKCLAAMAILAGATCGQPLVIEDMLFDAMLARRQRECNSSGMQEEDVRAVILALYTDAGALDSEWPDTKANRATKKHGEQSKAYGAFKKQQDMAAKMAEMGEDAAEAARPGAKDLEVDELAGRLGKAAVPDNKMPESDDEDKDDDEDEIWRPGKARRS